MGAPRGPSAEETNKKETEAVKFTCNFCQRIIKFRYFGEPKITCVCGAKYTKVVSVEVTQDEDHPHEH